MMLELRRAREFFREMGRGPRVVLCALVSFSSCLLFLSWSRPTAESPTQTAFRRHSVAVKTPVLLSILVPALLVLASLLVRRFKRREEFLKCTVTVDGPAASGKGAVARRLAGALGYGYIDTGSIYRAVGYLCEIDPSRSAVEIAGQISFGEGGSLQFSGNRIDDEQLRSEFVAKKASEVGQNAEVRERVRKLVRSEICRRSCVIEGRDCGSVIAPEANRKFVLTADVVERARRRVQQLQLDETALEAVLQEIISRDAGDVHRFARTAAKTVDCTWLSVDETVQALLVDL